MVFLPPPLPARPTVPILFKVTYAPVVELDTETRLIDARREGSAIGTTFGRTVNSVQSAPVLVLRGESRPLPLRNTEVGNVPVWRPVALLGGSRVAVALSASKRKLPSVHAASTAGRFTVSKRPMARRPRRAASVRFGAYGPGRDFPTTWKTARLRPGAHDKPFAVQYARASSGLVLGNGLLDTASGDMFDLNPQSIAIVRRNGTESPLKDFVRGAPDLGEILWISSEGWFVCKAFRRGASDGGATKLAWIVPIDR